MQNFHRKTPTRTNVKSVLHQTSLLHAERNSDQLKLFLSTEIQCLQQRSKRGESSSSISWMDKIRVSQRCVQR